MLFVGLATVVTVSLCGMLVAQRDGTLIEGNTRPRKHDRLRFTGFVLDAAVAIVFARTADARDFLGVDGRDLDRVEAPRSR